MIRSLNGMIGFAVHTGSRRKGKIHDILFDDRRWLVRHIVVGGGDWLTGRKVLVSPRSIEEIDTNLRRIVVHKSAQELDDAPDLDADSPVSRQKELEFKEQYGWMASMFGGGFPSVPALPEFISPDASEGILPLLEHADPHCRSSRATTGYLVKGESTLGVVQSLMADDITWRIPYVLVALRGLHHVPGILLPKESVRRISWSARTVVVAAGRSARRGKASASKVGRRVRRPLKNRRRAH